MGKTIELFGFPSVVPQEVVKQFLEQHTGKGSVEAVEVGQSREGGRAHANVQFATVESAEMIKSMADSNKRLWYGTSYLKARDLGIDNVLWYGTSYLKARDLGIDNVSKSRDSLENVTLHFGCQILKKKFSVLWKVTDVSVTFGIGLKTFCFYLTYLSKEYMLELSDKNIWQIELHQLRGQPRKFLLIQLIGAPRIYVKDVLDLSNFGETTDEQWVRDVDFTPSCSIGQSSAVCLELQSKSQLPNFRENFYYENHSGQFILDKGSSFSSSLDLVPIVSPPQGFDLPFEILFKVNSLVQHGHLPGPVLDASFYRLIDPNNINIAYIENALEKLYHLKQRRFEPANWLDEHYKTYLQLGRLPKRPAIDLEDRLVYVRRVQITPCKVFFCGPEANLSNRVLRNYRNDISRFIRVSFVDEDLEKIHSGDLSPRSSSTNEEGRTRIFERILSTLRNGIVIGDKKFEFLAFSSSQLRENSLWMFTSRPGLTVGDIRGWMGDFREIRNVAKYAARLGQSFSASRGIIRVGKRDIETIRDVQVERDGNKYVFSDGVGKISVELARIVAKKCGLSHIPSAFQIRYGGYKGVIVVDPASTKKLSLRNSMSKYKSNNINLDVVAWSKHQSCFLNRQLITLLSTLGIQDNVFETKQREVVAQLDAILTDPSKAQEYIDLMSLGLMTDTFKGMLRCGYKPDVEPFLSVILQTFRAAKLLELRTKARIFVPKGRAMIGCLDETATLEYGQVFVQYSGSRSRQFLDSFSMFGGLGSDPNNCIVEGKVIVGKNPCLHPGDIRILDAVNVPALQHIVDCVVFPQKGKRPHPNECSGSDLDGDVYFVSWDPDLIPPTQMDPMEYNAASSMILDHDVTIEEVEEYFTNYIVNDCLGIISNAHTVFADREPLKGMSDPCIELAKLFSIAVDFSKTGVPAKIPRNLRVKEYPDFMEMPDRPFYESQGVIGKLYREVKDIASSISSFTRELARQSYDPDMEVDGFEDYINDAIYYKTQYDIKLGNLMDYYGIKTEAEILSGCILKMSKSFDRRKDLEAINFQVRSLRNEARGWFDEMGNELDSSVDNVYAKASAWYHVTYHHQYWGRYKQGLKRDHFLSFPWCVHDKLICIKNDKKGIESTFRLPLSLERQFGRELHLKVASLWNRCCLL